MKHKTLNEKDKIKLSQSAFIPLKLDNDEIIVIDPEAEKTETDRNIPQARRELLTVDRKRVYEVVDKEAMYGE